LSGGVPNRPRRGQDGVSGRRERRAASK
jgi:hypothetical protein